ncbi:MAG: GtrA family protein [Limnochordaceae bacterium]|nr:GtrA family protein [Limnochordaceae bacterium]
MELARARPARRAGAGRGLRAFTLGVLLLRPRAPWEVGAVAMVAAGLGMAQSYDLQRRWVFRRPGSAARFVVVSLLGAALGAGVTALGCGGRLPEGWQPGVQPGMSWPFLARPVGLAVTAAVDYVGYATWAFRGRRGP